MIDQLVPGERQLLALHAARTHEQTLARFEIECLQSGMQFVPRCCLVWKECPSVLPHTPRSETLNIGEIWIARRHIAEGCRKFPVRVAALWSQMHTDGR